MIENRPREEEMQLTGSTSSGSGGVGLRRWVYLCVFPLTLLLTTNVVFSGQIVKYLPGFDGELPFHLETGYISVGESELFYYFIESQGNPKRDPVMLWLSGGPGCSSLTGLVYEIGPLEFDTLNYKGDLPKLLYYKYGWTRTASIIFLDAPVGTGYSYATTSEGDVTSDTKSAQQTYEFLLKWFEEHPQYFPLQLFLGGDSYSGIIVPLLTKLVYDGNKAGVLPSTNLRGYLVGSPRTDSTIDVNSKVIFAHRMALISDELYEAAKIGCNEDYVNVDSTNTKCEIALSAINWCVQDLFISNILEPTCLAASEGPADEYSNGEARLLQQKPSNFLLSSRTNDTEEPTCRNFYYVLSDIWANDDGVQDALHVRKGATQQWKRCNFLLPYTQDVLSVVDVHRYLSAKPLVALVQGGDRDLVVPYVGTMKWIKSLGFNVTSRWRPWFVDGQVIGYVTVYNSSDGEYFMTHATVKGAGHVAPEYKRRECYFMFTRWIHYSPL